MDDMALQKVEDGEEATVHKSKEIQRAALAD